MIIYDGYKNDFLHSVENDTIAIQIQENIYRKWADVHLLASLDLGVSP